MNRCKLEDFAGCYVDGSDKEISRAFQERLFSLGAKWLDFNDQIVRFNSEMTHICFDGSRVSWNSREYAVDNYSNEIEMKDLKPTPIKFVKVKESIFDLKGEFERGELYSSDCEGHYTQILGENGLFFAAFNSSIYRQVEIDWTDELGLFLAKKAFDGASVNNLDISDLSDKLGTVSVNLELRFNDFIEMCHKVAELTDKPE